MNRWLFLFLFLLPMQLLAQYDADSLQRVLDKALTEKPVYDKAKHKRIKQLRDNQPGLQEYYLNRELFEEYRKFRLDTAIMYMRRNLEIASEKGNNDLEAGAVISLANLYSSSGLYRESEHLLKNIDRKHLSPDLLPEYYENYSQFFEHYAAHTLDSTYVSGIETYRDSLLGVLEKGSFKYRINQAQADKFRKRYDQAWTNLDDLLKRVKPDTPEFAMTSFLMAEISRLRKQPEKARIYYLLSAIADTRSSVKDNASVQMLALLSYDQGDIDHAYLYTQSAVDDAVFCNAKFRTISNAPFFNLINEAYQEKEKSAKSELRLSLILISILTFLLILAVFFVYLQMRKLRRARAQLSASANQLRELNQEISSANQTLMQRNGQLFESNHIKEEYIGIFFDQCSSYIEKIENYRKSLLKAAATKPDGLLAQLKSNTIVEKELEELYQNFDSIFLNLFPNFVNDYNELLLPEERISVKPGELLNTELRLFALVRLGITDSVKIAAFLRYSLSTIYNYRTRARNKSAVSRDDFETRVMAIGNTQQELRINPSATTF